MQHQMRLGLVVERADMRAVAHLAQLPVGVEQGGLYFRHGLRFRRCAGWLRRHAAVSRTTRQCPEHADRAQHQPGQLTQANNPAHGMHRVSRKKCLKRLRIKRFELIFQEQHIKRPAPLADLDSNGQPSCRHPPRSRRPPYRTIHRWPETRWPPPLHAARPRAAARYW